MHPIKQNCCQPRDTTRPEKQPPNAHCSAAADRNRTAAKIQNTPEATRIELYLHNQT